MAPHRVYEGEGTTYPGRALTVDVMTKDELLLYIQRNSRQPDEGGCTPYVCKGTLLSHRALTFRWCGRWLRLQRLVYILRHGVPPPRFEVVSTCGTLNCTNIDHLEPRLVGQYALGHDFLQVSFLLEEGRRGRLQFSPAYLDELAQTKTRLNEELLAHMAWVEEVDRCERFKVSRPGRSTGS